MKLLTENFLSGKLEESDFSPEVRIYKNNNNTIERISLGDEEILMTYDSSIFKNMRSCYKIWSYESPTRKHWRLEGRLTISKLMPTILAYEDELLMPAIHHIASDIAACRIGIHIPTYISLEPMLTKARSRRALVNRPFRGNATNKNGFRWLSAHAFAESHNRMGGAGLHNVPEVYKPFMNTFVFVSGTECILDYKSFACAEDFIDFQESFSKFFFNL